MATDSINIITDSATTQATSADTVVVPKEHRAQYLGGFPSQGGNDTTIDHIDQMPVLEVPHARAMRALTIAHRCTTPAQ